MEDKKLFLCNFFDKEITIELIQTIYYDDISFGKHLYYDYAGENILISYFKADENGESMLKQVVPRGYDLSCLKEAKIDDFHKKIINEYQTFCERELLFFEEEKKEKQKVKTCNENKTRFKN